MLPLGVSAVTVGFGFLITLDKPPLDLRTSWILVPLAQALVGVPFVVRTMLPVLRAVDDRLREAAAVLGASPLRAWREVDLPLVRRAVAGRGGLRLRRLPRGVRRDGLHRAARQPDPAGRRGPAAGPVGELNYGRAMALSAILMLVCAVSLLLLSASAPTDPGSSERHAELAGRHRTVLGSGPRWTRWTWRSPTTASSVCWGPAAAGSPLLLRAVAGLQPMDAGRVLLAGQDQAGRPRALGAGSA